MPSSIPHLIGWWISLGIVSIFVGLRLWVRARRERNWGKDDYFTIATMLMLIVQLIVLTAMMLELDSPTWGKGTAQIVKFMKYSYAASTLYLTVLWMIKLQILAFYHRIMGEIARYRLLVRLAAGTVIVMGVTAILINALHCQPLSRQWNPNPATSCPPPTNNPVFVFVATANVLTDVLILLLPFPILRNLHQPMKVKLSLVSIFALGLFVIVVSIIRIVTILNSTKILLISDLSTTETYVAMIISTLPALRVLFLGHRGRTYGSSYTQSGPSSNPSRLALDKSHSIRSGPQQSRVTHTDSYGSDIELANINDKAPSDFGNDTTATIRKTTEISVQTGPIGTSGRESKTSARGFNRWASDGPQRV